MHLRMAGVTIVQFLLVLLVLGLVYWQATPDGSSPRKKIQAEQLAARFASVVQRARSEAMIRQQPVFFCAANLKSNQDLQGCLASPQRDGNWHVWEEGLLAFIDRPSGRAGLYDSKEAMLQMALPQPVMYFSSQRFVMSSSGRLDQALHMRVRYQDGHCWQWKVGAGLRLEEETCSV